MQGVAKGNIAVDNRQKCAAMPLSDVRVEGNG
jgi:hypothetical protein